MLWQIFFLGSVIFQQTLWDWITRFGSRRPLGLAVVGGMFFSTFLTLVIVPVVYTLLARFTSVAKLSEGQPEDGSSKVKAPPVEELVAENREVGK